MSLNDNNRDVLYSCGACGYALNLSSSQRLLSMTDSKYPRSAKRKATISFLSIDETRFKQEDEIQCRPYFDTMSSWGLNRLRIRLLCGSCGKILGHAHCDNDLFSSSSAAPPLDGASDTSSSGSGTPAQTRYCVKIKALQPSLCTDFLDACETYTPIPSL